MFFFGTATERSGDGEAMDAMIAKDDEGFPLDVIFDRKEEGINWGSSFAEVSEDMCYWISMDD